MLPKLTDPRWNALLNFAKGGGGGGERTCFRI